ncbi:HAMP domain-containing sensor histidine kinase [Longitalea arenae]|uniref:HAMP domain-containing sensor histidine kinase n=1 Tax=Longitalea arenae TaxID=2812558 RepID=UPI001967E5EC|nr:ATP-binding protein [Longitalea arenae]
MKSLRVRFAIGFSVLFTVFLAIALLIVYFSFADFRKDEFYRRLQDRALTTFKLLTEVEQVDEDLLKVIDRNTLNSLYNEKVIIFEGRQMIYTSIDDIKLQYDNALLAMAKLHGHIFTTKGADELVAMHIYQNNKEYTILAEAFDKYGRRKMTFLKWVMFIVYFAGVIIGWTATYFFVKKVIAPLESLKSNLQKINSANLGIRLKEEGQGEEVSSLAANFNQMLERLQQSFSIQKDFVHYASHELRTPLTAMIGITENALGQSLHPKQYRHALEQLYQQQRNLTGITNSLLLLSDNKIITERDYPRVRLDELLFTSVEIIQTLFPDALVEVNLEGSASSEELLMVNANEPLLSMAFNNLLKNALQYSKDNKAIVTVRFTESEKAVIFMNRGEALSAEEIRLIFTPFYRASNASMIKGSGLGLALVKQIAKLHKASIDYARDNGFTVFRFSFAANGRDIQVH